MDLKERSTRVELLRCHASPDGGKDLPMHEGLGCDSCEEADVW